MGKMEIREITKKGWKDRPYSVWQAVEGSTRWFERADRAEVEMFVDIQNELPRGYRVGRDFFPARGMKSGYYWKVTGDGLSVQVADQDHPSGVLPNGLTVKEHLLSLARGHAARAGERAAARAVREAEEAVREAEQRHREELERTKGPLATPRQVDYIVSLLERRRLMGDGGGFFQGPTSRAAVEEMSKAEASLYIDSLREQY